MQYNNLSTKILGENNIYGNPIYWIVIYYFRSKSFFFIFMSCDYGVLFFFLVPNISRLPLIPQIEKGETIGVIKIIFILNKATRNILCFRC